MFAGTCVRMGVWVCGCSCGTCVYEGCNCVWVFVCVGGCGWFLCVCMCVCVGVHLGMCGCEFFVGVCVGVGGCIYLVVFSITKNIAEGRGYITSLMKMFKR